jgi:hypothetical protein
VYTEFFQSTQRKTEVFKLMSKGGEYRVSTLGLYGAVLLILVLLLVLLVAGIRKAVLGFERWFTRLITGNFRDY